MTNSDCARDLLCFFPREQRVLLANICDGGVVLGEKVVSVFKIGKVVMNAPGLEA